MQEDSLRYDSIESRPLPKWLINQKEGISIYKPREIIIKEDNSLSLSFGITVLVILLTVIILTFFIKRKKGEKR